MKKGDRESDVPPRGVPLSAETQKRVEMVFNSKDLPLAIEMLVYECGSNIPFYEELGPVECERMRFAALRLSEGDLGKLREAIELAKIDSRDLLMAAGFGNNVNAHKRWMPQKPQT